MHNAQQFAALLANVGPAFDAIEEINILADDSWQVVFSAEDVIEVQLDDIAHKVCCVMPLGEIAAENRQALYETMLSWNLLKEDTGGFHLATDGPSGNAYLLLDISDVDLDVEIVAGVLEAIRNLGLQWREILQNHGQTADDAVPIHDGMDSAFIRA